jgi:hypothetical protein
MADKRKFITYVNVDTGFIMSKPDWATPHAGLIEITEAQAKELDSGTPIANVVRGGMEQAIAAKQLEVDEAKQVARAAIKAELAAEAKADRASEAEAAATLKAEAKAAATKISADTKASAKKASAKKD